MKTAGFTLTEVLASVVLLAAALTPVVQAISASHGTGTVSQRATRALFLAERRIEETRAAALLSFEDDYSAAGVDLGGGFYCNVSDDEAEPLLKSLRVEVGFDADGSGGLSADEIAAVLDTLIARRMGG